MLPAVSDLSSKSCLSSPRFPQPPPILIWSSGLLFLPASLGLARQLLVNQTLSHRLLALGLLLMSLEQARMARADLRQLAAVGQQSEDQRLGRFYGVLLATIGGELVGFYLAAMGWLGWGAAVILVSLSGFNLGAGVRLMAEAAPPIQAVSLRQRLDVLLLDGVALGLTMLWIVDLGRLWIGAGLLAITLIYQGAKLVQGLSARWQR